MYIEETEIHAPSLRSVASMRRICESADVEANQYLEILAPLIFVKHFGVTQHGTMVCHIAISLEIPVKSLAECHSSQSVFYRAVAITSRKHVTKHFVWQKKYCAQWQLKGSRCLTHDLCAIFVGFTQRDNCTIAIVNIIKA